MKNAPFNLPDFAAWRDRLTLLVVALLPWQARFIRLPGDFRGTPWEQGTIGVFALEIAVLAALLCHLLSRADRATSVQDDGPAAPSWFRLWAVFVLYAGVSVFWASRTEAAIITWTHLVAGFALAWLIALSRHGLRVILGAFLVGQTASAALGLWQFLTQATFASTLLGVSAHPADMPGVSVIETAGGRILRAYGLLPHPNIFGAYAALGTAIGAWLWMAASSSRARALALAAASVSAAALAASFSRAAWIALAFAVLVGLRSLRRRFGSVERTRLKWAFIAAGLSFAVVAAVALPATTARVTSTGRLETKSFDERGLSVARGVQLFLSHPALGVGLGNMVPSAYQESSPKRPAWEYVPAHLVPALAAAELGFFGLALVLGSVIFWFAALRFGLVNAPTFLEGAAMTLPLIPIIGGVFDHWPISTFSGIMLTGYCFGIFLHSTSSSRP